MVGKVFKVGLVGDSKVGKTCLLHQFFLDSKIEERENVPIFRAAYSPTIGVDYRTGVWYGRVGDYTLQIWDCSGHVKYRDLVRSVFPHLDGLILVFDIHNRKSLLSALFYWLEEVQKKSSRITDLKSSTMLLGTQSDIDSLDEAVTEEEQDERAMRAGIPFSVTLPPTLVWY